MSSQKIVVVTGVSSGIGRAVAQEFVKQGCRVFGTVRDVGKTQLMLGVSLVEMDVRDEASVQQGTQSVLAQASRIDVLVNNAGVSLLGSIEKTSIVEAQALFDINVLGLVRTTHAVLPHMRQQGSGRIVNVSSVLGFLPAPYMGLYSASKHAVEGLSETLDHEVRKFGIRVALVEPSFTRSKFNSNATQAAREIPAYDVDRGSVFRAIEKNGADAPLPDEVATTVVEAGIGAWKMRRTPTGQASLLRTLRRFMPAGAVDRSLRKAFGLDGRMS